MNTWSPKANQIFAEAAEFDDDVIRTRFIEERCGRDAGLRRLVESLLSSAESADQFLEEPAITSDLRSGPKSDPGDRLVDSSIDRYKILERIGEGGFGIVYLAQQKEPVRRRVALKVIKPGMDTREVIARFEAERQALATMDHPNIARVLDAGATNSGHPYFVMEHVRGVSITEFCDENRLDVRARLQLFQAACDAIKHAHRRGIIHRDIKPSNVMVSEVDGKPRPQVIDFGIAKAVNRELTGKTLFTRYGSLVGTPQYMSPEQAADNAADVDTRSDVYSLGVLLYELLTGTTPTDSERLKASAFEEMRRIIREEEPPTPSDRISSLDAESMQRVALRRESDADRLRCQYRGELDWIVMRALEKDRDRRYDDPKALAEDIRRYLDGEAVEACPPSWTYKTGKSFRKHRLALAFSVAILALLCAGIAGTTVGLMRVSQANVALADKNEQLVTKRNELRTTNAVLAAQNERIGDDYLSQAFAAAQNNTLTRARELVAKARSLGVSEIDAEIILGSIAATENGEQAIAHFQTAVSLDKTSVAAHAGLASVYAGQGDSARFFGALHEARQHTANTALDFQFLSQVVSMMGDDYTGAVQMAEQGLEITDSPTARGAASIVFALAALPLNDLELANKAHEYAAEASISLGRDHFLSLGMRLSSDTHAVKAHRRFTPACCSEGMVFSEHSRYSTDSTGRDALVGRDTKNLFSVRCRPTRPIESLRGSSGER